MKPDVVVFSWSVKVSSVVVMEEDEDDQVRSELVQLHLLSSQERLFLSPQFLVQGQVLYRVRCIASLKDTLSLNITWVLSAMHQTLSDLKRT